MTTNTNLPKNYFITGASAVDQFPPEHPLATNSFKPTGEKWHTESRDDKLVIVANKDYRDDKLVIVANKDYRVDEDGYQGIILAEVRRGLPGQTGSNANLMAAAPELLRRLDALSKAVEKMVLSGAINVYAPSYGNLAVEVECSKQDIKLIRSGSHLKYS